MRFPIVLKLTPDATPPGEFYYEVAANGVFQVRKTPLYRAVTRATLDVPGLQRAEERLDLYFPPLPAALIEEVLGFFAAVFERWCGEAIVLLFYRSDESRYLAIAPPQRICGYRDSRGRLRALLHIEYQNVARPQGFLPFGSIHSHADLSAYASGVDCDDELGAGDGLHVVYGHFGTPTLSRCAAFTVNGTRFRVEPDQVLPHCAVPPRAARREWMDRVHFDEKRSWYEAAGYGAVRKSAPRGPSLGGLHGA